MIFVTVGSQLPLERLIKTIDDWAINNKEYPIFAQIGHSKYTPKNFSFCQSIEPIDYHSRMSNSDIIIAHAGMGTIITALELGKPLLLMPRLAEKGEHRNNHQLATIKRFSNFSNITIAENEQHLPSILTQMLENKPKDNIKIETKVSIELIDTIKKFVN
jgi:UDP-N-acetylglucosamine transferase subunit ALG13